MNRNQEFREFLNAEQASPPPVLSQEILRRVQSDLAVHSPFLFAKLLLIHLAVGGLTLLFCPQFGIGPLGGGEGLTHFVMRWGSTACAVICGAIFLGSSALVVSFAMSLAELRALRKHLWAYYGGMAFASAGILLGLGQILPASGHVHLSLAFLTTWLASAMLTATGLTAFVSWTRKA